MCKAQRVLNTRLELGICFATRTRLAPNTKHQTPGISGLLQQLFRSSLPWRRYLRIITANPDQQPSMEKMDTIEGQTLNYFSIQSCLDGMISLMRTSKITLSTNAISTRYSTRYSDFLLLHTRLELDSKLKTTSRWGLNL